MTTRTKVVTRACVIGVLESVRLIVGAAPAAGQTREQPPRPLAVARHAPAAGATGVLPTAKVSATFTKRIDPATLSLATFFLTGPGGPVPAAITYDAPKRTATLTPSMPLRRVTGYEAHLTAGIRDRRGTALVPVTWSFESSTDPALARAAFPFSEGQGATSTDSSGNGNVARLIGNAQWATNGKYGDALLLAGGRDGAEAEAGDAFDLANSLTIEAWIDPTSLAAHPTVLMREVEGDAASYSLAFIGNKGNVTARIRTAAGEFVVSARDGAVPVNAWTHLAATYDGTRLRLYRNGLEVGSTPASGSIIPSSKLLWLGRGPKGDSLVGMLDEVRIYSRALPAAQIAADMLIPADDITPPAITSITPAANAAAFDPRLPIVVTVSRALAPASVTSTTVLLRDTANAIVPAAVRYQPDTSSIVVVPNVMLVERATYTATVSTDVANSAGIALQNPYSWTFTTADVTPPRIVGVAPLSAAVDVDPAADVAATFSEDVVPAAVNGSTFELRDQASLLVPATVTYASGSRAATLHPASPLLKGRTYVARIKGGAGGVTDLAGNTMAADYTWSFTTHQDLPPQITNLSPNNGMPGTAVSISGARFGNEQGSGIVRFNGLAAAVSSWSDTNITATAPPFVTTGDVTVTVGPQVSNGVVFTYTGSGPNVTVTYQPKPNAAGWYRTPVQAFFTCSDAGAGVQSCPSPITIASEGAAQDVAVTATDVSGHYTAVYPSANIDFTPPVVTITSPHAGEAITAATTQVMATVSDAVSGIQSASCNGVAAAVSGTTVSCTVALGAALNPIAVRAIDLAGNERSAGVVVSRTGSATALSITPLHHTLAVGDTRELRVTDDLGRTVLEATWSSSNVFAATVDSSGTVTAVAPGDTQITAALGSLSASASVSVLAGALPPGTTTWSDDSTPDWFQDQSTAVDAPSAALATTEIKYNATFQVASTQVRTFDEDGHQVGLMAAPLASGEQAFLLMGDSGGGLLMLTDGFTTRSIVRVPLSADDTTTWRAGGLTGSSGNTAQGPDGTVFTLVGTLVTAGNVPTYADQAIVGIDGQTGVQRFSVRPIKPSYGCDPFFGDPDYLVSRIAEGMTVDTEGYANVLGVVLDRNPQSADPPSVTCHKGTRNDFYQAARVVLYRVAPDGTTNVIDLYRHASLGTFTFRGPVNTLPDDEGGVLATWEACDWSTTPVDCRLFARHVDVHNTLGPPYELPHDTSASFVSGSNHAAFFGSFSTPLQQFDTTTGSVQWTSAVGIPMAARADGRLEAFGVGGLVVVDPAGAVPTSVPVEAPLIQTSGTTRITARHGDIRSVVGESFLPDQFGFALTQGYFFGGGGGLQRRRAAPGHYGVFFKGHFVTVQNANLARHASLRITPRNPGAWQSVRPDVFDGRFTDSTGHTFATLGAGPGDGHTRDSDSTSACHFSGPPLLTKGINASSDGLEIPTDLERLHYAAANEESLALRLLQLFGNYRNDLQYCFDPSLGPLFYNSNSFINGLLSAAHVFPAPVGARQSFIPFEGWTKPLPSIEFGVAP